jgi:hypothetical protein
MKEIPPPPPKLFTNKKNKGELSKIEFLQQYVLNRALAIPDSFDPKCSVEWAIEAYDIIMEECR